MAKQDIILGSAQNDGTGEALRSGGLKINANFGELYQGASALFLSHGTVSGGTLTLTRNKMQRAVLSANTAVVAPSGAVAGDAIQVELVQDATGNRTVSSWPASFKWPNAVPAALSTAANAEDVLSATFNGTNWKVVVSKAFA